MILHIPHSSTTTNGLVELQNKEENLYHLTDIYTVELFSENEYTDIVFPLSRFVCDVERFMGDPMKKQGQGIIYTKDAFGNDIKRNISNEAVIDMYNRHHDRFNQAVNHSLTLFHKCIVIDCHSFTPSKSNEVDFCIGTDCYHTPIELIDIVHRGLCNRGYSVNINDPYSGTIMPSQHYKTNKDVYSIMIEVNKNIYINDDFNKVRQHIQEILKEIEAYEDSFG